MKRGDMLLITVLLVAALMFLAPRWIAGYSSEENHNRELNAVITVDGKPYQTVKLTKEEQIIEIRTDHGLNRLRVRDYGIEMIEADCPDKVCLDFGFVTKKNQSIVCLPNKVLVELEGGTGGGVVDETDAIVN